MLSSAAFRHVYSVKTFLQHRTQIIAAINRKARMFCVYFFVIKIARMRILNDLRLCCSRLPYNRFYTGMA